MYEYSTIFGMDTHARSVTVRAIVIKTGEVKTKKFANCPTPLEIAEWMRGFPAPRYAAYESGCTGFHLCRELRKHGIACDVIAVSSIARSTDDKIKKNTSGSITKAGNSHIRRYLMEGSNSLVHQDSGRLKTPLLDAEVSAAVRAHAKKGSRRLVKKIKRLKERGKESNIIKVAAASELIRWVWAIGLMVQEEQQQLMLRRQ